MDEWIHFTIVISYTSIDSLDFGGRQIVIERFGLNRCVHIAFVGRISCVLFRYDIALHLDIQFGLVPNSPENLRRLITRRDALHMLHHFFDFFHVSFQLLYTVRYALIAFREYLEITLQRMIMMIMNLVDLSNSIGRTSRRTNSLMVSLFFSIFDRYSLRVSSRGFISFWVCFCNSS